MSLELSGCEYKVVAKTGLDNSVSLSDDIGLAIDIPLADFCCLIEYVLTNTDLIENDPRLKLIDRIKHMYKLPGYNKGNERLVSKRYIDLTDKDIEYIAGDSIDISDDLCCRRDKEQAKKDTQDKERETNLL
jgi:hypothetical protein